MKDIFIRSTLKILLSSTCLLALPTAYAGTDGERIFLQNCLVCHGEDGSGAMPGVSDLTENTQWLAIPDDQLMSSIKNGIQKPGAAVNMPPKGGNPGLTDDDIKAVITYMRNTLFK